MNQEDKQKVFENAYKGLWNQNKLSIRITGGSPMCSYRGKDGCKCAIGHLISNEFYKKSFEGKSAACVVILEAVSKSQNIKIEVQSSNDRIWTDDALFFRRLQNDLHDRLFYRSESKDQIPLINKSDLKAAAIKFGSKENLGTEFLEKYTP